MSDTTAKTRVNDIIIDRLSLDPGDLNDNLDLRHDLNADNQALIDVVTDIETEWPVSVADGELWRLGTVGDVHRLVHGKLGVPYSA